MYIHILFYISVISEPIETICNVFERPFVFVDFNIIFEQAGTL